MTQILRDSHGHKNGEIQESCGKKIVAIVDYFSIDVDLDFFKRIEHSFKE